MTDRELERRAKRRLAVLRHAEEVSGNVAATCRSYGISIECGHQPSTSGLNPRRYP